ncbi:23S rRNA (adenine(1618)-N(6))-methyltransferase RlmF [Myroides sp. LJL119]
MGFSKSKKTLHPRSKHHGIYSFSELIKFHSNLSNYIIKGPSGIDTIDFSNAKSVNALNTAILKKYYKVRFWEIPQENLCPAIPGRADYIHYLADLLALDNNQIIPTGNKVRILDIGTGASIVYPLIGSCEYQWNFVGSDISSDSIDNAKNILKNNTHLQSKIKVRLQNNPKNILKGIIQNQEFFDAVICNPPFFKSLEDYQNQAKRKNKALYQDPKGSISNFSGSSSELFCKGGEKAFIENYIYQSVHFSNQVRWFTTLVSKQDNLPFLQGVLKRIKVTQYQIIDMGQGNKKTRVLAWRFN